MSDPQVEDGHVRIANSLYEALVRAPIPGRHFRVWSAVLRETWGWRRKVGPVSTRSLAARTGIDQRSIRRVLDDLVGWRMLTRTSAGVGRPTVWSIQKDFEQWSPERRGEGTGAPGAGAPGGTGARGVHALTSEGTGALTSEGTGAPPLKQDLKTIKTTARASRGAGQRRLPGTSARKPRGHPAVALWCELYRELLGTSYAVEGRAAKRLKDRWESVPPERFEAMARLFLSDPTDREAAETGYSVAVFDRRFDRLNRRAQAARKRQAEPEPDDNGEAYDSFGARLGG